MTEMSRTFAIIPNKINEPTMTTVSSFITYNSWEMAVARRPVPKTTVPVLVTRLLAGTLWIISAAFWSGGGLEPLDIERLLCEKLEGSSSVVAFNIRKDGLGESGSDRSRSHFDSNRKVSTKNLKSDLINMY